MVLLSPLVVMDADSTTLQDEVIELLADEVGERDQVAAITERAMRGEIDFSASLRERVRLLHGAPLDIFDAVAKRVRAMPGLTELVHAVHAEQGIIGVVSGGFHEILDLVLPNYGLDIWVANRLEVLDSTLTGELYGPIIDADAKAATLRHWSTLTGIPIARSFAVGDGANDLKMMEAAGTSIAFNAKPIVQASAAYTIDERDLSLVMPIIRSTLQAS